MDTSTFSLRKASELINPHMKDLPFRPIKCYVHDVQDREVFIGNTKVCLNIFRSTVDITASLLDANMMNDLHVDFKCDRSDYIKKVTERRLLLQRTTSGCEVGIWHLQTTFFGADHHNRVSYSGNGHGERIVYLTSTRSKIVQVDEKIEQDLLQTPYFIDTFWQQVVRWIDESVSNRTKTIEKTKKFADECEGLIQDCRFTRRKPRVLRIG